MGCFTELTRLPVFSRGSTCNYYYIVLKVKKAVTDSTLAVTLDTMNDTILEKHFFVETILVNQANNAVN